jgi:hypothetical protein
MTTEHDHGTRRTEMLYCETGWSGGIVIESSMRRALRDMREANGRDPRTGAGRGNNSRVALVLAMIVLDTLSGNDPMVGRRWRRLLTSHGISEEDAELVYELRCALLHGYGSPALEKTGGAPIWFDNDPTAYALDTSKNNGWIVLSVPVFCGRLVERIAAEIPGDWDTSLINTDDRT